MADDDDLEVSEEEEIASTSSPPPLTKSTTLPPPAKAWQTKVREGLSPYLPPPVIQAIQRTDPQLEPYVGPEGTVTLLSSLLVGWFILKILRSFTKSGRAIDDDDDAVLSTNNKNGSADKASAPSYDATVLLVGPSGSGKTRLFYRLCYGAEYSKMPTLLSLKANVGYSLDENNNSPSVIRYMDWPGLASLTDKSLESVLCSQQRKQTTRTVLVLDATQPVAAAADVLYHLLDLNQKQPIFVACHKTDFPKAKNWRRIKIQIRTELERLLKLSAEKATWWPTGKALDLEALPLHFCSTSSEGILSPELLAFCQAGKLPESAK